MSKTFITATGSKATLAQEANVTNPTNLGEELKSPRITGPNRVPVSQPVPGKRAIAHAVSNNKALFDDPFFRPQISALLFARGSIITILTAMEGVRAERNNPIVTQAKIRPPIVGLKAFITKYDKRFPNPVLLRACPKNRAGISTHRDPLVNPKNTVGPDTPLSRKNIIRKQPETEKGIPLGLQTQSPIVIITPIRTRWPMMLSSGCQGQIVPTSIPRTMNGKSVKYLRQDFLSTLRHEIGSLIVFTSRYAASRVS